MVIPRTKAARLAGMSYSTAAGFVYQNVICEPFDMGEVIGLRVLSKLRCQGTSVPTATDAVEFIRELGEAKLMRKIEAGFCWLSVSAGHVALHKSADACDATAASGRTMVTLIDVGATVDEIQAKLNEQQSAMV